MPMLPPPSMSLSWNEFSILYDELYTKGEEIFTKYNLCDVKDGECKAHRLFKSRSNFCCKNCQHLGQRGCKVKALYCKLWICQELINTLPDNVLRELGSLFNKADRLNMLRFRASKEETFRKGNSSRNMWNRYLWTLEKRRNGSEPRIFSFGNDNPTVSVNHRASSS